MSIHKGDFPLDVQIAIEEYAKRFLVPFSGAVRMLVNRALELDIADADKKPAPRPRLPEPGFVYLIRNLDGDGLHKIGLSTNPIKRARQIARHEVGEIELVCAIETPDMPSLEQFLHDRFREWQVRGEWFRLPAEGVEYMLQLASSEGTIGVSCFSGSPDLEVEAKKESIDPEDRVQGKEPKIDRRRGLRVVPTPQPPANVDSPELRAILPAFVAHRRAIRKPLRTTEQWDFLFKQLANCAGRQHAVVALKYAMANGWLCMKERYMNGKSWREIASELGLSLEAEKPAPAPVDLAVRDLARAIEDARKEIPKLAPAEDGWTSYSRSVFFDHLNTCQSEAEVADHLARSRALCDRLRALGAFPLRRATQVGEILPAGGGAALAVDLRTGVIVDGESSVCSRCQEPLSGADAPTGVCISCFEKSCREEFAVNEPRNLTAAGLLEVLSVGLRQQPTVENGMLNQPEPRHPGPAQFGDKRAAYLPGINTACPDGGRHDWEPSGKCGRCGERVGGVAQQFPSDYLEFVPQASPADRQLLSPKELHDYVMYETLPCRDCNANPPAEAVEAAHSRLVEKGMLGTPGEIVTPPPRVGPGDYELQGTAINPWQCCGGGYPAHVPGCPWESDDPVAARKQHAKSETHLLSGKSTGEVVARKNRIADGQHAYDPGHSGNWCATCGQPQDHIRHYLPQGLPFKSEEES